VFKQNDSGAMLMVKVPGVLQDSVVADFQSNSVKITFAAKQQDEQMFYELALKPFAAIIPEKCRFDVATRNMVVVLWKEHQGETWEELLAQAAFVSSESFTGAKRGYVFKLGPSGVGYYTDEPKSTAAKQLAKKMQHQPEPPAEPNPEPTPEPIQYGKPPAETKADAQGSIDAGNVCFVNTMMYELD
jgi:hypothetical protein